MFYINVAYYVLIYCNIDLKHDHTAYLIKYVDDIPHGIMMTNITLSTYSPPGNHSLMIYVMFAPGHGYVPEYSSYGMLDDYRVFSYDSNSGVISSPLKQHASLTSVWKNLGDCTAFKTGYFQSFTRRANATLGLSGRLGSFYRFYMCSLIYYCFLMFRRSV